MKTITIVKILLVIIVGFAGIYFSKSYISLKKDKQRLEYNITNINQQLDSVVDKNGELHYTVNSLNLKASELNKVNSELNDELKNMKIKIKNLQNASVIDIQYKYIHDTIYSENIIIDTLTGNTIYKTIIDNPYYSAKWNSTIVDNNINDKKLLVTDYQTQFNDTIITATEIKYKGWWFWRKPKEIKFHIKSKNPYSKLNQVENIKF